MKVRIANIVPDTVVDGPGLRTSVYFQGCQHRCKGCHNPQTWNMQGGLEMEVDEVVQAVLETGNKKVTISGGDPFYQPEALKELLEKLREKGIKNIWAYTGFVYEKISVLYPDIVQLVNTVVDGPFVEELKDEKLQFRGSSNQRIITGDK